MILFNFKARHGRQKHLFFLFFTGQFWDFGIFVFNNMSSFRLVVKKKSPKYTFRSLFYYTLSVCVCRFLINSTKVGVLNQHAAPIAVCTVITCTAGKLSLSPVQCCRIQIWSFPFYQQPIVKVKGLNAQSHWLMINL